jgi:flagellar FliJ protein
MDNALEFLLDQAKEKESQAIMVLSKARNELEGYYQQLKQIEQYRLEYCQQLVERGQAGLSASQYGHLNRFLTQLDETLAKQRGAENHFKQQVENSQQHWLHIRQQRRSYEWLIDKKRTEQRRIQERREQNQMDEFSTLNFNRQRNIPK